MLRKLCDRTGAGYLDTNAVISLHGSKGLLDTDHHNRAVLELTLDAVVHVHHHICRTQRLCGMFRGNVCAVRK